MKKTLQLKKETYRILNHQFSGRIQTPELRRLHGGDGTLSIFLSAVSSAVLVETLKGECDKITDGCKKILDRIDKFTSKLLLSQL